MQSGSPKNASAGRGRGVLDGEGLHEVARRDTQRVDERVDVVERRASILESVLEVTGEPYTQDGDVAVISGPVDEGIGEAEHAEGLTPADGTYDLVRLGCAWIRWPQ